MAKVLDISLSEYELEWLAIMLATPIVESESEPELKRRTTILTKVEQALKQV